MAAHPMSPPLSDPTASATGSWRERTFGRLIDHLRALLPVGGAAFLTVDEDRGRVEHAAGWYATDELRDALEAPGGRPLSRGRRGLVEATLDRDRPLFLPSVDAWEAAPDLLAITVEALGADRAERAWRTFQKASLIACSLRSEIGRALGVVFVASLDAARPLRAADIGTVEVAADLAAMSLERADLLEAEGRRARDELRLKHAAEAVSGSLELDEVYRRVVQHAAGVTGATKAVLTRLNTRTGDLRCVARLDFSGRFAQRRLSLNSGSLGQVARTRSPVLRRLTEAKDFDLSMMREEEIGSAMHAPIQLGPRLYGVLTVAHTAPDCFSRDDLDLLARLARSSAAAIANATDFQRERRIAQALTLGFVPESLPEVPGYETGLLYVPAANEPTGGDVYGAWPAGDGDDIAILVGDVAGKGVETAALSAMVRFFVEARSWDALSPSLVLEQANAMLMSRLPSETFVTAFLGVLSPGSLRYCNAGHLPPLLVSGGEHRPLEGHGLPLGIDESPGYGETELELAGGDLVFAYTDGLIEARRRGEVYGPERLARLVSGWAGALRAEELVSAVHDEIAGWAGGLADDAVALALRRRA